MKISIVLQALTGSFITDMQRAGRETDKAAKKMQKDLEQSGKAIGQAFAIAATAVTVLIKNSIDNMDRLDEAAQRVGVSAKQLSTLEYAAKRGAVSSEQLEAALGKLAKSASDTAAGTGTAARGFAHLGIEVKKGDGTLKSTEQLLMETATEMAKYEDSAQKTAVAQAIFGKSGKDMLPFLNQGAKGMQELQARAKDLGLEISDVAAAKAGAFNDVMGDIGELVRGVGNDMAQALLPKITQLGEAFVDSGIDARKSASDYTWLADTLMFLAKAFVVVKAAVEGMTNLFAASVDTVIGVAKIFKSAAEGMGQAAAGALKALTGDLGGADKAFALARKTFSEGWTEGSDKIKNAWAAALVGVGDSVAKASVQIDAINKPIEDVAENVKKAGKQMGAFADEGAIASAEKLAEKLQAGQEKLEDLRDSFVQFNDPVDAAMATFRDQIIDIGRVAAEQQAVIDALRASGQGDAADQAQAKMQAVLNVAAQNAIATRDRSIESIMRERDVTSRYVEDLADEARLIGMSAAQQRVETVVMRALTEAKKANLAAGKEIIKIDEARIRQQASLNEALATAAQINVESPFKTMISDIERMTEALKAVSDPMNEAFDPKRAEELTAAINKTRVQLATEFVGAAKESLQSLQSMTTEGSKSFQILQVAIGALSIAEGVLAVIHQLSSGDVYSAIPRAIAVAAAIASLGVTIGNIAASGFSDTAAERQATQGTGSVLGDAKADSESIANSSEITANATSALVAINRGMLSALQALQSALGSASNQLARGAGSADFSGLDLSTEGNLSIWEQNDLIGRLIGGSSKITDEGIIIFGGALNDLLENIAVGAYQEVQSRSSLFGSTHTNEGIVDVSDQFGAQFQLIIGSIVDTVREGAEAIGLLPADIQAALDAFAIEAIRISLKDLSAEEQQAEIAAVFSQMFDGLAAQVVPFIGQFQQVGEGLGETLIRVATEVQVVQESMRQLGLAIDEADPERFAQISDALITATGGIDAFISGMQSFVSNFATDADRLQVATDAIRSAFEQAGLTVPATDDAMWALLRTLDATTEEGRDQIATLLRLSDTARQYYDLLEKAEKARQDYIQKAYELQLELGSGSEFIAGRSEIERWADDTAIALNDLAHAAGRTAASEQDLVNVQAVAAKRLAQLIAQLKSELRDAAVTLGYTTAADTVESLTAQIESLSSSSSGAADAIGSAIDSMREKMALLLGDLSPFNDQKKLELALEGLRAGTVDASTVLEIGRRLYASTANYTNLFNQVMGMAQFGQGDTGSTGGVSEAEGRTLAELTAARDALLAAQRPELADNLAHRLAEIAFATGEDFASIAEEQGFSLDQLGADLNLSSEQLNAYLQQLADQFKEQDFTQVGQTFQFEIRNSTDRIVAAITGQPIEAALDASDQRMDEITNRQSAEREASNERVVDAIRSLTSAVVASGAVNADKVVDVLQLTRRDIREGVNGDIAGSVRGYREPRVLVR